MKASILTFSQTGNTLKVGHSIIKGLIHQGIEAKQTRFLHKEKWDTTNADIIGVGCPCFENRPAECVTDFLKESAIDLRNKKAFVFITSGESPAKTLFHLAKSVEAIGADVIGGIQIRGAVTVPTMFGRFIGRPNDMDLDFAESFGKAIGQRLLKNIELPNVYTIDPKQGGVFYDTIGPYLTFLKKKITPLPECNFENCTQCGNCIYECPTKSIGIENAKITFTDSCIVCYRCWHVCPENAI